MSQPNDPRPSRQLLTQSGTYRIFLRKPKQEFINIHEDGTAFARLRFETEDGSLYFDKVYGTRFAGSFAMLVGKFSGRFTEALPEKGVTAEDFMRFLSPACQIPMTVGIEVAPVIDKTTGEHAEYKGVKKYSYSIRFPKKGETIPDADKPKGGEAIEF
jgi:hypothetical protein